MTAVTVSALVGITPAGHRAGGAQRTVLTAFDNGDRRHEGVADHVKPSTRLSDTCAGTPRWSRLTGHRDQLRIPLRTVRDDPFRPLVTDQLT